MMRVMVLAAILAMTGSARADWPYTRWGEPLADVLASPGVKVRRTTQAERQDYATEGKGDYLATAPHKVGDRMAVARFYFRANKLATVVISTEPGSAREVRDLLVAQYGAPLDINQPYSTQCLFDTATWRDMPKGNLVKHFTMDCGRDVGQVSEVTYTPLASSGQSGL